jgi:hypothetical protein
LLLQIIALRLYRDFSIEIEGEQIKAGAMPALIEDAYKI